MRDGIPKMLDFPGPVPTRKRLEKAQLVLVSRELANVSARGEEVKYLFVKEMRREIRLMYQRPHACWNQWLSTLFTEPHWQARSRNQPDCSIPTSHVRKWTKFHLNEVFLFFGINEMGLTTLIPYLLGPALEPGLGLLPLPNGCDPMTPIA